MLGVGQGLGGVEQLGDLQQRKVQKLPFDLVFFDSDGVGGEEDGEGLVGSELVGGLEDDGEDVAVERVVEPAGENT